MSRTWLLAAPGADHVWGRHDLSICTTSIPLAWPWTGWKPAGARRQPCSASYMPKPRRSNANAACPATLVGRASILEYWRPKLTAPPPRPFRLEQIWPDTQGVALVYRYREPTLIRVSFRFDRAGKIEHSRCRPEPQISFARPSEIAIRRELRVRGPTDKHPLDEGNSQASQARQPGFATGRRQRMQVRPLSRSSSKVPPSARTRSCIPVSPRPKTLFGGMPAPLSATSINS